MQGAQESGREAYSLYVERHDLKRNAADEPFGAASSAHTQPVGLDSPANLHAPFAGPVGKSS